MLREIGAWLDVNGEGIYGTRPWHLFGEGPTQVMSGAFTDTRRTTFTSEDIRFTAKGDSIYAHVMAWPADGTVKIRSLGGNSPYHLSHVSEIVLLGDNRPLKWQVDGDALRVDISECAATGAPLPNNHFLRQIRPVGA